ncbi:MAG: oligosaccharide flippase family protein [Planctomycetota bacterium JB042]
MSLSRRVTGGAVWQLGARLFSASVMFVVTAVVLARTLPEAEYGRFHFHLTLYLLVTSLVDFGVNRAAIRMVAAGEAARGAALAAAVRLKLLVGALGFVAMAGVALLVEPDGASRLLLVIAAAHALAHGCGAASIGFEVDVRYRAPATSSLVGQSLFLVAGLALAAAGVRSAAPYLLAWAAGLTLQNLKLYAAARARGDVGGEVDRELLVRLAREAAPLGLSAIAVAIYYYSDTLMLRPFRGEEEVARYSTAYRLMTFGLMTPVLFSQVVFPVFTRCRQRSSELLREVVRASAFYLALLGALGGAVLGGLAPELLEAVYGATYRGAAPVLEVLAVAMVCVHLTYPHTTALIASGHAADFTRITAVAAALNVGANLVVLPRYGAEGAAATTLGTEAFVLVAGVVLARRRTGVTGLSGRLLGPAALAALLVVLLRGPLAGWHWAAAMAAAVALAAGAAVLLGAFPFRLGVDEEHLAVEEVE